MIFKNVSFLMDFGSRRISVLKNHKANTIGLQQNILLQTNSICLMIFRIFSILMDFGSRRISVLKNHQTNTIGFQQKKLLQTNNICLMILRILSILMDFRSRRISVLKNHQTNTIGLQQKSWKIARILLSTNSGGGKSPDLAKITHFQRFLLQTVYIC